MHMARYLGQALAVPGSTGGQAGWDQCASWVQGQVW